MKQTMKLTTKYLGVILIVFFILTVGVNGADSFKELDRWKLEDEPFGRRFVSVVDCDYHVVGGFFKSPIRILTPRKILKFGNYGQGPSDLTDAQAVFMYKGDLAIVERADKLKIFSKKDGIYKWKETKWFKRGKGPHKVRDAVYFDNKFFFAGHEGISYSAGSQEVAFLKVFDHEGNVLKQLIRKTTPGDRRLWEMRYYIEPYGKEKVFFLAENELKVSVISSKELKVLDEIPLEAPSFYTKMPKEFYKFKKADGFAELNRELENWAMGYSAITETTLFKDKLILQIRTCSPNHKKFALLIYDVKSWKLERTFFTDDLLLGSRDGKFYFFANGNPGRDEDTDQCIINVLTFGS